MHGQQNIKKIFKKINSPVDRLSDRQLTAIYILDTVEFSVCFKKSV